MAYLEVDDDDDDEEEEEEEEEDEFSPYSGNRLLLFFDFQAQIYILVTLP
jgi:hypothetical protein